MNSGQPNPGIPMQLLINNLDALGQHSTQVIANASNWLEEKVLPQTLNFEKLAFELVPSNFKFPQKNINLISQTRPDSLQATRPHYYKL